VRLGFIGTGAISEHIIIGLIQHGGFEEPILVSARSRHRSERLASRYSNVTVESDNQRVVAQSDVVFLGTLPQQTLSVLDSLTFRPDQTIVSMPSMLSVEQVAEKVTPASKIHRIVPMPPNELGVGPIPVYPPSPELAALLSPLGTIIPVEHQEHFSTFSASSAIMATMFELVATNARWMETKGVEADAASRYTTALFHSLATQANDLDAEKLRSLSADCLTAGGLNEQFLNATKAEGWYRELEAELDRVLARISK